MRTIKEVMDLSVTNLDFSVRCMNCKFSECRKKEPRRNRIKAFGIRAFLADDRQGLAQLGSLTH